MFSHPYSITAAQSTSSERYAEWRTVRLSQC